MLDILIKPTDISASFVIHNTRKTRNIIDLPKNIRDRIVEALKTLNENGVETLEYDKPLLLLMRYGKEHVCSPVPNFLDKGFVEALIKIIALLDWSFEPHIYSPVSEKDNFNLSPCCYLNCPDCGYPKQHGFQINERCQSTCCPSHEKWAEIDSTYFFEDDNNSQKNLIVNAFMGIPRTGTL